MFNSIASQASKLATYTSLKRLYLDLTEGVWDWDGGGSPQAGATPFFEFPNLGFPAVNSFEIKVSDLTLSDKGYGPMTLVNWNPLEELTITVRHWCALICQIHPSMVLIFLLQASAGSLSAP